MKDNSINIIEISNKEFKRLGDYIENNTGLQMPDTKKILVQSRLSPRLIELKMKSYTEYIDFISSKTGEKEIPLLIDAITTNETSFFRSYEQFDFIIKKILPDMITVKGIGVKRQLKIWSAGCSSGEEPYSLAMLLELIKQNNPGLSLNYFILATDISNKILQKGIRAVYDEENISDIPVDLKKNTLLKSRDRSKGLYRIIPEVRENVKFRVLNLLNNDFKLRESFDIIFYRNVQIYFKFETRKNILQRMISFLNPGGYLFLGYSENITDMNLDLENVGQCIFRKPYTNS